MAPGRPVLVAADMVCAYGRGVEACWTGLLSNRSAASTVTRFPTAAFANHVAATVPGLDPAPGRTLAMRMLEPLLDTMKPTLTPDTLLVLATTVGEIDLLEAEVLTGFAGLTESRPQRLLERVAAHCGLSEPGMIVSAACASGAMALARAHEIIAAGRRDRVFVVAVDCVTEFVYSGFSTLGALSPTVARPMDAERNGLLLGEAAVVVLLSDETRAHDDGLPVLGRLLGHGHSADAYHMTEPARDGSGLALAIHRALSGARLLPDDIGFIGVHGTGTPYNDAMEMNACRRVFGDRPRPVVSVKGGVGHTLGAAGLIDALMALRSVEEGEVPPTVGLRNVDPVACGWASPEPRLIGAGRLALTTSAGFGGINTALVLRGPSATRDAPGRRPALGGLPRG